MGSIDITALVMSINIFHLMNSSVQRSSAIDRSFLMANDYSHSASVVRTVDYQMFDSMTSRRAAPDWILTAQF